MVESNLQNAVRSWQSLIGLRNLIWLPRLTAGIYALTNVLRAKKVIVPNNCCLNVVYGVLLGGAEPVFCEIDIKTGSLNVNACEELLERTKAEMVVHVHLFGLYRLPIHGLCKRFGAMYFEDAACWFPPVPSYEILPASCLGLSFGFKKIFELGGGGILCCADAPLAYEVGRCLESLPEYKEASKLADYESAYGNMIGPDRLPASDESDFSSLAFQFRALWINKTGYFVNALSKSQVDGERRRRRDLSATIGHELSQYGDVETLADTSFDFPWRFSFLTKNSGLVERIFGENGFFVSRLYPPLDRFFPKFQRSQCLDNSYRCGAEIFNIPLDAGVRIDRIKRAFVAYRRSPLKRRLISLARLIARC